MEEYNLAEFEAITDCGVTTLLSWSRRDLYFSKKSILEKCTASIALNKTNAKVLKKYFTRGDSENSIITNGVKEYCPRCFVLCVLSIQMILEGMGVVILR